MRAFKIFPHLKTRLGQGESQRVSGTERRHCTLLPCLKKTKSQPNIAICTIPKCGYGDSNGYISNSQSSRKHAHLNIFESIHSIFIFNFHNDIVGLIIITIIFILLRFNRCFWMALNITISKSRMYEWM